ncbi:MAG: hypothetical protein R3B40_01465 [Polyangiales bacterium]|nr:hypothetical protein [Sandaracinaceae bacterium]
MFNRPSRTRDLTREQNEQIAEIEAHLRGVAGNLAEVSRLWASQGLRVAQSSLKVAEDALRDTARTLGELREDIEG